MVYTPDLSSTSPESNQAWWRDWFNETYLDVYAHRDQESAAFEVQRAVEWLSLDAGSRVLDLCCGSGRHCHALADAGLQQVTGLDYSLPLLQHAKAGGSQAGFIRGDMRLIPIQTDSVDAVLSFFTSFGYFHEHIENLSVLNEMFRVLRPRSRFLIDYLNPAYVRAHLQPESERNQDGVIIREFRQLSSDGQRIEKEIVIENADKPPQRFYESVRLYSRREMTEMLASVNLEPQQIAGSFSGEPFDATSPRMLITGQRNDSA